MRLPSLDGFSASTYPKLKHLGNRYTHGIGTAILAEKFLKSLCADEATKNIYGVTEGLVARLDY